MIQVLVDLMLWLAALVLVVAIAAVVLWAPPLILAFWRGLVAVPEQATPRTDPYLDEPIYCWIGNHERPRREMRWVNADYVCTEHAEMLERNHNVR